MRGPELEESMTELSRGERPADMGADQPPARSAPPLHVCTCTTLRMTGNPNCLGWISGELAKRKDEGLSRVLQKGETEQAEIPLHRHAIQRHRRQEYAD